MRFEVGEVVILVWTNNPKFIPLIGTEVTIIGCDMGSSDPLCAIYKTDIIDKEGDNVWGGDRNFRKKNPPQEEKEVTETRENPISWKDTIFQPESELLKGENQ